MTAVAVAVAVVMAVTVARVRVRAVAVVVMVVVAVALVVGRATAWEMVVVVAEGCWRFRVAVRGSLQKNAIFSNGSWTNSE